MQWHLANLLWLRKRETSRYKGFRRWKGNYNIASLLESDSEVRRRSKKANLWMLLMEPRCQGPWGGPWQMRPSEAKFLKLPK